MKAKTHEWDVVWLGYGVREFLASFDTRRQARNFASGHKTLLEESPGIRCPKNRKYSIEKAPIVDEL